MQGITKAMHYAYDITGRLEKVWRNDTLISTYSYDANGNRLARTSVRDGVIQTDSGYYDSQDRMLSYSSTQYSYTSNGELRQKIEGIDTTKYTYDNFGNLRSVRLPNGDNIEYLIDGQNRRIGKKINGTIVKRWIYSGQLSPIAELDSTGNVTAQFVSGYMVKNGNTYKMIKDHLGSVRLVVDVATGTVAQRLDYDEYGNITTGFDSLDIPFAYAGGLYDSKTKLVRFGARDYEASVGRWTNKDPIGFGGGQANIYAYVNNNPIDNKDINGLWYGTRHMTMSFQTAIAAGHSLGAAAKIAYYSGFPADLPYQGENAGDANRHGMSGYDKEKERYQTPQEAQEGTAQFIKDRLSDAEKYRKAGDCDKYYENLGFALHAMQDLSAPLHVGYPQWHDSIINNILHIATEAILPW